MLYSDATRIDGDPEVPDGEQYALPSFETITPEQFITLSSSGPIWRAFDAALVVEDGIGRICDVDTDVLVDELGGCDESGIVIDTHITSSFPSITTWYPAPILAFQDPLRGFTNVIPLAGSISRNDAALGESTQDAAAIQSVPTMLLVGDSVMMGAASELADRGYTVDTTPSRQLTDAGPDLTAIIDDGLLDRVPTVLHLGTNGPFDEDDLDLLLDLFGDERDVYLLTVHADRPWTEENNELVRAAGDRPNVTVIDWAEFAEQCPGDCFMPDGIHLAEAGREYYADVITQATDR